MTLKKCYHEPLPPLGMALTQRSPGRQKMSWRLIPVVCVLLAFIMQLVAIQLSKTGQTYTYLESTLVFVWFLWIALAFHFDKFLPMTGLFGFDSNDSKKQTGRGFATIAMTLLYIIIVGYDIKKMFS
jgi:hypothetical protein